MGTGRAEAADDRDRRLAEPDPALRLVLDCCLAGLQSLPVICPGGALRYRSQDAVPIQVYVTPCFRVLMYRLLIIEKDARDVDW
jgi:hypothetical protein